MPAWPGGNCPDCGDFMPPNLITCQTCRAMLNPDLKVNVVDVPTYIPLKELDTDEAEQEDTDVLDETPKPATQEVLLIAARGIYFRCPGCSEELKIPNQFVDAKVQCNHCAHNFQMDLKTQSDQLSATYANCPHCEKRIRATSKMTNQNVACKYCQGALHIQFEQK